MINYPWIVNKDIVIVDLVAAEEDTFMLICTGAPVPQKIMRIFFFDLWCPTWDTRGVIRSRLTLQGTSFFSIYLPGGSPTWRKMTYIMFQQIQQILCCWSWLKQDTFWMAHDTEACARQRQPSK